MLPGWFIAVFAFVLGLVLGSFLNVCILRIPQRKSIVLPASACPNCGAPIHFYDNIPVISYLILQGKCRGCKTKISPMYPVVELLTGFLFLLCYLVFGLSIETLKWCIFSALIVVLVFTDFRERILPDAINYPGLAIGLLLSLFTAPSDGTAGWLARQMFSYPPPTPAISLADALLGAAVGSSVLWLVSEAYYRLRHREGMGLGDVKMMLMAGAFLGLKRTVLTILAGSLIGSVLGGIYILCFSKGRDFELPFGVFLGIAALVVVFFGTPIVTWYVSLMRV